MFVSHTKGGARKSTTLGERLEGDRPLWANVYELKFGSNVENAVLCSRSLNDFEKARFINAIHRQYYYELIIGLFSCLNTNLLY